VAGALLGAALSEGKFKAGKYDKKKKSGKFKW
jgi:hypothetical protein